MRATLGPTCLVPTASRRERPRPLARSTKPLLGSTASTGNGKDAARGASVRVLRAHAGAGPGGRWGLIRPPLIQRRARSQRSLEDQTVRPRPTHECARPLARRWRRETLGPVSRAACDQAAGWIGIIIGTRKGMTPLLRPAAPNEPLLSSWAQSRCRCRERHAAGGVDGHRPA